MSAVRFSGHHHAMTEHAPSSILINGNNFMQGKCFVHDVLMANVESIFIFGLLKDI